MKAEPQRLPPHPDSPSSGPLVWRHLKAHRSSAATLVTPLFAAAAGLGSSILVARNFGADGRGEYAVAIATIMAIAQVASLGLGEALAVHMARNGGPRRPRRWILTVWGIMAAVACLAWPLGPSQTSLLVVGVATASCFLHSTTYALASGSTRLWAIAQLLQPLAVLTATLFATILDLGLSVVLAAYVSAPAVAAFVALKAVPSHGTSSQRPLTVTRQLFALGLQRQLTVSALALVRRVDVLALGVFGTLTQVGHYAVAMSLVDLALMAPWALSGVMLREELKGSGRTKWKVVRGMAALTAGPLLCVAAVGWWLVPVVWGSEFDRSYIYFLVAVPGAIALGATRGLSAWHMGRGTQGVIAKRYVILLLPVAGFICVGAALGGPYGVAGASGVGYLVLLTASLTGARSSRPGRYQRSETLPQPSSG